MFVCAGIYYGACVEVREQLEGVGSLPSPVKPFHVMQVDLELTVEQPTMTLN